jgi:hypothetical protein
VKESELEALRLAVEADDVEGMTRGFAKVTVKLVGVNTGNQ